MQQQRRVGLPPVPVYDTHENRIKMVSPGIAKSIADGNNNANKIYYNVNNKGTKGRYLPMNQAPEAAQEAFKQGDMSVIAKPEEKNEVLMNEVLEQIALLKAENEKLKAQMEDKPPVKRRQRKPTTK